MGYVEHKIWSDQIRLYLKTSNLILYLSKWHLCSELKHVGEIP